MTSFERIVTHLATATVAKEVIEQPNVNLESLKQVILNLFNAHTALSTAPGTKPCHIGNVSTKSLTLPNALLVPKLSYNLLSVGQLCDLGLEVTFSAHGCRVQDPRTGQLLGTGRKSLCKFHINKSSKSVLLLTFLLSICGTHDSDIPLSLTPMDGSPLSDPTRYRQLVGSLVYLTTTHPDIAYAVHIVSQFMAAPRSTHYAVVLRIIRYVKGTLFHGLHFSANSSHVLRAYFDADWASDPSDRRSTTGYCLFLEAEYRALEDTTSELLSLRWLLKDMGIPQPSSTDLYCDNQSDMQIAHNDVFHECTKHIEVDCHVIRHHVAQGTVHLVFIGSADQPADLFTKAHFPRCFYISPSFQFLTLVSATARSVKSLLHLRSAKARKMFKKKLPEDVVTDILSHLPANSLVRFKSVRKSWIDRDGIMIMANPGIGEFRFLPVSCFPLPNSDRYDDFPYPRTTYVVGLGFDCRTNDCKVIRILEIVSPYYSPGEVQAEVYSSSTNIWREIEYADYYGIPENNGSLSTYWNGAFYWPALRYQDGSRGILSFNFSDEAFEFTPYPEHSILFYNLIEFNETLAFISYPHREQGMEIRFDIWVMGESGAVGVWTKLLSTEPLLGVDRVLGFGKSNELFVLLSSGLIASYNIVTNQMKTLLPIDGEDFVNNHSIVLYKGSLVSINREIFYGS
ncbi:hypothetical protein SLEP1_g10385 [Rubroshorea leprosula]|uniref:F-box associated beta-propeller type 1 domain-containing protein n=1 Tax=Rubroshorea leprosula TaxID=152421 RepID=A0AAV5IDN1_9ROSI|nr:hypothetical protein SLEP1_g10385 [Rubroshorea leprosula]